MARDRESTVDNDLRVVGDLYVEGKSYFGDDTDGIAPSELAESTNREHVVPFTDMRVWDNLAALLPAASATDDLGLYEAEFGTGSPYVGTGDTKTTTVTRYARFLFALPPEYVSGATVTIRAYCGFITTVCDGAGTIDFSAYLSDNDAGIGSDLVTTAATDFKSTTPSNKDFVVTPTGLVAGNVLDIRCTIATVDTATGTAVDAILGKLSMLVDCKG